MWGGLKIPSGLAQGPAKPLEDTIPNVGTLDRVQPRPTNPAPHPTSGCRVSEGILLQPWGGMKNMVLPGGVSSIQGLNRNALISLKLKDLEAAEQRLHQKLNRFSFQHLSKKKNLCNLYTLGLKIPFSVKFSCLMKSCSLAPVEGVGAREQTQAGAEMWERRFTAGRSRPELPCGAKGVSEGLGCG